jgi:general secretion pathway protein F
MAIFAYRAVTAQGEAREGTVEAASAAEAGRRVSESGLIVLSVEAGAEPSKARRPLSRRTLRRKSVFGEKEMMLFTRELAVLLKAGLPLDNALGVLGQVAAEPAIVETVHAVRDGVRGGRPLSQVISEHEGFSRFYVNMVRAGEAGGILDEVLARLADHLERARALRETVVSALIYPVILLSVALISVVVLLVFVVPQFADLFADMGKTLPLPTRIVIGTGGFLTGYWWLLAALVGAGIWYGRRWLADPLHRAHFDAWLLRLPLFGELALKAETTRFSRTFGTLLRSGVSVAEALGIAGATASNAVVSGGVEKAAAEVRRGRRISDVLGETTPLPPLSLHLIRVGEESGDLDGMLHQVADIFDNEVQATIKRLLAVLEPALILGLGVVIAGIIISILIAILGVNELAF